MHQSQGTTPDDYGSLYLKTAFYSGKEHESYRCKTPKNRAVLDFSKEMNFKLKKYNSPQQIRMQIKKSLGFGTKSEYQSTYHGYNNEFFRHGYRRDTHRT